ncbi:MAG: GNAT family N-acetyltransferase, partial [Bdellovibrionales bacterium]
MLETGYDYGSFSGIHLAAISGVHVFSRRDSVAALGNIATHPQYRGQGHATALTLRLCQELWGRRAYRPKRELRKQDCHSLPSCSRV